MKSLSHSFGTWRPWPLLLLFVALALGGICWPIVALDFDLWYHLTGGSYITAHGHVPTGPFFSFFTVDKGWVDYYWLFQVLVHALYQSGGYPLLIALRAVLFLALIWSIWCFIRDALPRDTDGAFLLGIGLLCAYTLALVPREIMLRPHAFTYLYIVVLHLVANQRQRWAWSLPVLTIFWANLHGVEYPVIMLVCGAYLAEYFADKLLRRPQSDRLRAVRWPLILSLYAVFATPAGIGLLAVPFSSPPFHALAVIELARQPLQNFLALFPYPGGQLMNTSTHLLVLTAILGAVALAFARRLRLSRLLLLAGGLVLLPLMRRFTFEFILLTIPLLGDLAAWLVEHFRVRLSTRMAGAFAVGLVCLTLFTLRLYLGNRPYYPVDQARLPVGVCNFLEQYGPGGRIFNVPNPGGYLQWRLYPKYRIGMDMETMLFSNLDFYTSLSAFGDKTILGKVLEKYNPGFLLTNAFDGKAKKVIAAFPRFEPVFFDDMLLLYADKIKYPKLVSRFQLKALDVTTWQKDDYKTMDSVKRDAIMAECRRLLVVYPEGMTTNTIAAKILLATGKTAEATIRADLLMRNYPDRYIGYGLKGLIAFQAQHYEKALRFYKQALARAMPREEEMVRRNMYAAYVRLRQFGKAYAMMLSIRNPMTQQTSAKDLYDMSLAAVASGHEREGRALLAMARLKVPESKKELAGEIEAFYTLLPSSP